MKNKVVSFLKHDRTFDGALKLYMQHGNRMSLKRTLNNQGYSEQNHGVLLEQMRIEAGISPEEYRLLLLQPVTAEKEEISEIPVTPEEKATFIREIPEQIRKAIRLRDEYPFLASPDCPNELKILVHDMITAYGSYVDGHKRLFEATTGEELQKIAAGVVENYIENHEIWDELNHYKTASELLGKHAIFAQSARIAEIKAMSTADQVKLQKNLMNNLARTKQKITEQPDHKNTADRKASVAQFEFELTIVNPLLGLDA